jgi:hypothetical protein
MAKLTAYDKFIQMALKYGWLPPAPIIYTYGLPKTNQTDVIRAGDDATYQKGYPLTGARFTDNGDGTITDNATGLMWVKDATGAGAHGGLSEHWAHLIDFCQALDFAGHTDWRMPNIRELLSLPDYGTAEYMIVAPFVNTEIDYFYSSTHAFYDSSQIYRLDGLRGRISLTYDDAHNWVLPCRLGQPAD